MSNSQVPQVPTAPPLDSIQNDDNVSSNADIKSVFDDPEFLKRFVGKMDAETKEMYEKELSKKTEERL
jgi:hypothetical protein